MFNFLEIQTRRPLSEQDVLKINCIIKRRAYRYIAAGREEWLYPERHVRFNWRAIGDEHLLMPTQDRCIRAQRSRSAIPEAAPKQWTPSGDRQAIGNSGMRPGVPWRSTRTSGGATSSKHCAVRTAAASHGRTATANASPEGVAPTS
jgi:hypothetical protein